MRIHLGFILLVSTAAGCAEPPSAKRSLTADEVRAAKRFVVTVSYASGIYGGPAFTYEWTFEKEGRCHGLCRTGTNADGKREEKRYTLPSKTFLELQKILIGSGFFETKAGKQNERKFEEAAYSMEVECAGKKHRVEFVGDATGKPLPQFRELWDFAAALPERGREVKAGEEKPEGK
jgi:hypothetical protein